MPDDRSDLSIDSPVLDRFVAAAAAQFPDGAGEVVHGVGARYAGQGNTSLREERTRASLIIERAVFLWCVRALELVGETESAAGLRSMRNSQTSFIATELRRGYASALAPHVDASTCCSETADALFVAGQAGLDPSVEQLADIAGHLGTALAAALRCGAVTALPDEVDVCLRQALDGGTASLTWD